MAFDREQFGDLVERTLRRMGAELAGPDAQALVLGTAAVESDFGTYLRQLGGGPARGPFGMEPPTFAWLAGKYRSRFCDDWTWVSLNFAAQEWDLVAAIVFCRLRYRVDREPIPAAADVDALARYWKRVYNTELGAGTVEDFTEKFHRYVTARRG
jgi:hypothetical protein